MRYLLDTHTLLWYFQNDENLTQKVREIIDREECYVSLISIWEIAIKQSIGKLKYSKSIREIVELISKAGFNLINFSDEECDVIKQLPFYHKDPFDRMLIAQAKLKELVILSKDEFIPKYPVDVVW